VLNIKQAYLAMFYLLDEHFWETTKNDSLGGLLGSLDPCLSVGMRIFGGNNPAFPATWQDWLESVRKISDSDLLSNEESFQSIVIFLKLYMTEFGFEIGWILDEMKNISLNHEIWLSSVKKSIEVSKLY